MLNRSVAPTIGGTTLARDASQQFGSAVSVGGLLLIAHGLWLAPLSLLWRSLGAELLLALPGALLALLVLRPRGDPLLQAFVALCGGLALQIPLLLGLHTLPGPLSWNHTLIAFDGVSLLLSWPMLRDSSESETGVEMAAPWLRGSVALAGILLIGMVLRLRFLGSAELQGDEARALLLGFDVANGRADILLWHSKGPVEVLLPAGLLVMLRAINEWAARLPFALAGVGVPLGAYLLARDMLGTAERTRHSGRLAGLIAAAALALDGFLIAFARIVQYQNILVLMTIGAAWCCWRFYSGVARPQAYLIGAAVFAAIGMLAHYDGVFVLPMLAWLVIAGARRRGWPALQSVRGLALPMLIGAVLLARFYVPFVLHEHFGHTLHYLGTRTGQLAGTSLFFNNLTDYYRRATFYNTAFQIDWLSATLAISIFLWVLVYVRPRVLAASLAALLLFGCVVLIEQPWRFELWDGGTWAIVAFAPVLAGLALAPRTPAPLRALILWFAPPFIAEAFLFAKPMTHFYNIDVAAALLIGVAVARLVAWLHTRRLAQIQLLVTFCGAALLLLSIPYMYIVFVRQAPEYRAVFPSARPELYRAIYQDQLPTRDGYFGLPHRAGWKVIGELYRQGILKGDFDSNEDFLITHWYTRKSPRCDAGPEYYFLAQAPVDRDNVPLDKIRQAYHLFGVVIVDGLKQIEIYSRQPTTQPARNFRLDDYSDAFDRRPLLGASGQALELEPVRYPTAHWQNGITLVSNNLKAQSLVAGQDLALAFQWSAAAPLDRAYQAFVDIMDHSGRVVGSIAPFCNSTPPQRWHTHAKNDTSIIWPVTPDLTPGVYALRVGLRDAQNGASLRLSNGEVTLQVATFTVAAR